MTNIIGISGKASHGKDLFSNIIIDELKKQSFNKKIYKTSFASPIKEIVLNMFPFLDSELLYGSSELRKTPIPGYINPETNDVLTIRDVLCQTGKLGRSYNPDCWVYATTNKFPKLIAENKFIIIADARFKNECKHLHSLGAKIIRIIRPGVGFTTNDISETDLDDYTDFDKIIINNTLDDLRKAAIDVINEYIIES